MPLEDLAEGIAREVLVSQFYGGSLMMQLDPTRPAASRLWQVGGRSELPEDTRSLHALVSTPVVSGDYVFGIDSYGELRCLDARTGTRLWDTQEVTTDHARWASAFFVRRGGRYFINNDKGELIIARLSPEGYEEIDRTFLIEPTTNSAWGRRQGQRKPSDRIVNWSHPAYAMKSCFVRNDSELILSRP